MSDEKNKQKVTVEELLQLKKMEKPDDAFWDSFEKNFERKRLNALLEKQSPLHRLGQAITKLSYVLAPAAVAVALGVYSVNTTEPLQEQKLSLNEFSEVKSTERLQASTEFNQAQSNVRESSQNSYFVMDELTDSRADLPFRRVMTNTAMKSSLQNSTRYVDNPISSPSAYRVTTAAVKAGYNF